MVQAVGSQDPNLLLQLLQGLNPTRSSASSSTQSNSANQVEQTSNVNATTNPQQTLSQLFAQMQADFQSGNSAALVKDSTAFFTLLQQDASSTDPQLKQAAQDILGGLSSNNPSQIAAGVQSLSNQAAGTNSTTLTYAPTPAAQTNASQNLASFLEQLASIGSQGKHHHHGHHVVNSSQSNSSNQTNSNQATGNFSAIELSVQITESLTQQGSSGSNSSATTGSTSQDSSGNSAASQAANGPSTLTLSEIVTMNLLNIAA